MSLLQKIQVYSQDVLQYENKELQKKAADAIPIGELEDAAVKKMRHLQMAVRHKKMEEKDLTDIRELLLIELLDWFKNSFFSWVDAPLCSYCKGSTKFSSKINNADGIRVEIYKCTECHRTTDFSRYNDPRKLLQTRRGRCGEWANCFTLLCRAMGWDARHVVDVTDHVWTEVYSVSQERWLHCDPCENVLDKPLMYEEGWGKQLSYVLAFSHDDVQDVTWRYTRHPDDVLARRKQCSEAALLNEIFLVRHERQHNMSKAQKSYITRRLLRELVEFMTPHQVGNSAYEGRTSGSLAWRMARGEAGLGAGALDCGAGYVWQPTESEKHLRNMHILYSCAQDRYLRPTADGQVLQRWEQGVFQADSLFRKEEPDWNTAYLARTEGAQQASVSWKVDCSGSGLLIDTVQLHCGTSVFESGSVRLQLCAGDVCVRVSADNSVYETKELSGSDSFTLQAKLSGGMGRVAWQHAQLFRQSLNDKMTYPLSIVVTFTRSRR